MSDWYYIENIMDGRIEIYTDQLAAQNALEQKPHEGENWFGPEPVVDDKD